MRVLDRYILKPVILTFLGCLFVFIFLYIISDILGRLDEILKNRINSTYILRYYLTFFPIIFTQTSPVAILLATIYVFGKLGRDNELIALRASGQNLWQICLPVIILGAILSISIFYVNEKFVPSAHAQAEKIKNKIEGGKGASLKEETIHNLTFYGLGNRLFFVNSFDVAHNAMKGITILEHDQAQNMTAKITASEGKFNNGLWTFYECTKLSFDRYGQIAADTAYSQEQIMDITETPQDFLQQRKRPELMTIGQLEDYIWRLEKSNAMTAARNLLVDLHQRYASSISSLVLILIGIPFSFTIRKHANIFSSFGICILISFLYYVFTAVWLALGKAGVVFPFLCAWGVPAGFSYFAVRAIQKTA
jgi:LPS export ABC transporter permease LptG